jgi:hypothetical protein
MNGDRDGRWWFLTARASRWRAGGLRATELGGLKRGNGRSRDGLGEQEKAVGRVETAGGSADSKGKGQEWSGPGSRDGRMSGMIRLVSSRLAVCCCQTGIGRRVRTDAASVPRPDLSRTGKPGLRHRAENCAHHFPDTIPFLSGLVLNCAVRPGSAQFLGRSCLDTVHSSVTIVYFRCRLM